jgi:hypothetical protein
MGKINHQDDVIQLFSAKKEETYLTNAGKGAVSNVFATDQDIFTVSFSLNENL